MASLLGTKALLQVEVNILVQALLFLVVLVGIKYGKTKTSASLASHHRFLSYAIGVGYLSVLAVMLPTSIKGLQFGGIGTLFVPHKIIGAIAVVLSALALVRKDPNVKMHMRALVLFWILAFVTGALLFQRFYMG